MPVLAFNNTMTRSLEPFRPLQPGRAGLYTCGPTVYNYAHIGNWRAFVFYDLLRRTLEARGYQVVQVMNLTDVDDKIIRGAHEKGVSLRDFTAPFVEAFFEDREALNLEPAEHYPRATDHVPEMVAMIQRLLKKGVAYGKEGSVYYRIEAFPDYGRLAGLDTAGLRAGARIDSDQYDKEDVRDFVLWKAAKPGEHFWASELGPGRPGWHLECSAIARRYLGDTFDIHAGGVDLIFPHHTNEIAQSEAASGQTLARYWLHSEHLIVEGEKMSKSKGNFFTLRDLVPPGADAMPLRYLLLTTHYRQPLNFTRAGLVEAEGALARLRNFLNQLSSGVLPEGESEAVPGLLLKARERFDAELDSDLNISGAMGALFTLVREVNAVAAAGGLRAGDAARVRAFLEQSNQILGFQRLAPTVVTPAAEIARKVEEREGARRRRDFTSADRLRAELLALGYVLEDTPQGTRVKRASA
jgi:cysteinyl-tRNA synthetase